MRVEQTLHRVAQVERTPHGHGALVVSRHPEREKRRGHTPLAETRDIHVAGRGALCQVGMVYEDSLGGIDVAVDSDSLSSGRVQHEQTKCQTHWVSIPRLGLTCYPVRHGDFR